MSSNDSRSERRIVRPRRRAERVAVEGLETRQLMTYSPYGYSLPQLTVSGYAPPTASWGGPLTIDVNVQNIGASSLVEPLDLAPGSTNNTLYSPPTNSTADAPATTVDVFISTSPKGRANLVKIDTVQIPSIPQNSNYETISSITLPAQPAGFPRKGANVYLTYVVNNNQAILQNTTQGNVFRVPAPLKITNPLPDLQVVGFDIPTPLHPNDVIAPTIRIANFGSGNTAAQGPVTVQLVASLDKNFGPGDAVVGSYTIANLPGISGVPTMGSIANDANVIPTPNENTTTLAPLRLPAGPGFYYLGIVIDPANQIKMTTPPSPRLRNVLPVGPHDKQLNPTGLLYNTNGNVPVFPALPSSVLSPTVAAPALIVPVQVTTSPILPTITKASSVHKKSKH